MCSQSQISKIIYAYNPLKTARELNLWNKQNNQKGPIRSYSLSNNWHGIKDKVSASRRHPSGVTAEDQTVRI